MKVGAQVTDIRSFMGFGRVYQNEGVPTLSKFHRDLFGISVNLQNCVDYESPNTGVHYLNQSAGLFFIVGLNFDVMHVSPIVGEQRVVPTIRDLLADFRVKNCELEFRHFSGFYHG